VWIWILTKCCFSPWFAPLMGGRLERLKSNP
jgi:hypothetical protein